MRELMPGKKALAVLTVLLLFIYLVFGLTMNPQYMPGIGTHILTWLIYLLIFALLYINLKRSRKESRREIRIPLRFSWRFLSFLSVIFIITMTLKTATGVGVTLFLVLAMAGALLGLCVLLLSVMYAVGRRSTPQWRVECGPGGEKE
jgi:amino acid transporter